MKHVHPTGAAGEVVAAPLDRSSATRVIFGYPATGELPAATHVPSRLPWRPFRRDGRHVCFLVEEG